MEKNAKKGTQDATDDGKGELRQHEENSRGPDKMDREETATE